MQTVDTTFLKSKERLFSKNSRYFLTFYVILRNLFANFAQKYQTTVNENVV